MTARLALLVFVVMMANARATRAQLWRIGGDGSAPRARDIVCFADGRVLPAGIFFGGNRYDLALDRCPQPAGMLVVRNVPDAATATTTIRSLRSRALAPGYPFVVERRVVGLAGTGFAVVVGTFASAADATAYRTRLTGVDVEFAARFVSPEWTARMADSSGAGGDAHALTQIVSTQPVPAYAPSDVAHIDESYTGGVDSVPHETYWNRARIAYQRRLAAAAPLCEIQPDTVFDFVIRRTEANASRNWSPVRCGDRLAYVLRDVTNTEGVVWLHRDGRARVTQVTLVECDRAVRTTWVLERGERSAPEHTRYRVCRR